MLEKILAENYRLQVPFSRRNMSKMNCQRMMVVVHARLMNAFTISQYEILMFQLLTYRTITII